MHLPVWDEREEGYRGGGESEKGEKKEQNILISFSLIESKSERRVHFDSSFPFLPQKGSPGSSALPLRASLEAFSIYKHSINFWVLKILAFC